jgi:DNA-binding IclR family transcriptional regulator
MEPPSAANKHTPPTNSLDRALTLLELLLSRPRGLTHSELCGLLGMPSSTCTYITRKLELGGYLRRELASGRFKLGLKAVSLAHGALHGLGFRSIAEPVLYRLTVETGLSAGIGVLQSGKVLVVDRVDGPDVVEDVLGRTKRSRPRENRDIGRELPLHSTALGKVLLAYQNEQERDILLKQLDLTNPDLREQVANVRKQGYATAEDYYISVRALAVPILDPAHRTKAAL